jgi:hypothetical protein
VSVLSNPISTAWRWFRGNGLRQADTQRAIDAGTRINTYDINVALYDNTLYQAYREWVLRNFLTDVTDCSKIWLAGFFNPVKEIVDLYVSNVLPGVWGRGIEIDPLVDGEPVNAKLAEPVRRIWRDSNLDTLKSVITKYAANFGTVGMRIQRTPETIAGDRRTSRVRITEDHPSRLFNIEEDGQGNVTAVVLKYDVQRNFGTLTDPDFQSVEVIETLTQDEFSQKIGGKEQLTDAQRRNPYGFCPYVILRHKDNGTQFGDYPAALAFVMQLINQLRRRQPEMAVGDLQLYANISGESVAQVLKQAESAILDVRPAYDHAFIRAIQMGLSIGMTDALPGFDVGAGTGEGSGERAYNQGLETFQFKPRPALPQTPAQQMAQANANVADQNARFGAAKLAQNIGTDVRTTFEVAGFDEAKAQEIIDRKRQQDVTIGNQL